MPGLPTLIVEDNTGTERFTLNCIRATRTDSLVELWTATATVDRAEWLTVNGQLDEVNDRVRIERGDGSTFFEGRFRTDERDGNTINVRINSYEQDAIDAQPTDALEIFQNVNDSAVFTDAIGDIPTLTAGTVETGATGVSFSFANAERSKQIRDAAEPAGQDLRYNFDRTVDFVNRLGTDTAITVSNTDQSIVNSLSVVDGSKDAVTHIRGLGAQQGNEQVTAEAVIPSYSTGDRQVWREYVNKDIVNEDRLQTIVDRLATEYDQQRRRLRVEAGLLGVDVSLGDSVTVDIPDHDIDQLLRIVWLREILTNEQRFEATLTNRSVERGDNRKRRDDLERFNTGWQGFVDRDSDSYGWQPVTASVNATRPYRYPDDVQSEKLAKVDVNSIPYRAYSQGADVQNGTTLNINQANSLGTDTTLSDGDTVTVSDTVPQDFSEYVAIINPDVFVTSFNQTTLGITVTSTPSTLLDEVVETSSTGQWEIYLTDPNVESGDTIDITIENLSGGEITLDPSTGITLFDPNHNHAVAPGLTNFPDTTVTNADLIVNGSTVATNIGSGEFDTTVDIAGKLTPGSNTIELSSDTLGLTNLTVRTQLFRQGTP